MLFKFLDSKDKNPSKLSENVTWLQEKQENTSEKQINVLLEEKEKSKTVVVIL